MSRGIVSQKPFSRKKHRQSIRKTLNRSGVSIPEFKISKKIKNILSRSVLFTALIACGTIILMKSLFFKPEQTISQIKFSDSTLATYQDIELFNLISNEVKGKNYYMLLSNKDKLLSNIQKKFPFVGSIEFQLEPKQVEENIKDDTIIIGIKLPTIKQETGTESEIEGNDIQNETDGNNTQNTSEENSIIDNSTGTKAQLIRHKFPLKSSQSDYGGTLGIELIYIQPRVLVKLNEKKFAIRSENVFAELQEGMLLSTEKIDPKGDDTVDNLREMFTIETPGYITGTNNLSGFFFEISLDNAMKIASLAKEEFGNNMKRFVYLAGSRRFAIFTSDDKTLYFNFPEGLNIEEQRSTQILKYNILRERYQNFNKIEKIDLGALEDNKTIIMNY